MKERKRRKMNSRRRDRDEMTNVEHTHEVAHAVALSVVDLTEIVAVANVLVAMRNVEVDHHEELLVLYDPVERGRRKDMIRITTGMRKG